MFTTRHRWLTPVAFACTLLCALPVIACLWDSDTLAQERTSFPDTLEILAGKFARHSPAYYQWRITDRQARLAEHPDHLPRRDDLAVAYDKLDQHDKAIELMHRSLELDPDRYETHANLGTFHLHAGEFESGIAHLERALAINPDAHFGRERYQLYLAVYLLERRGEQGEHRLPMMTGAARRSSSEVGYAGFVLQQVSESPERQHDLTPGQRQAAIEGVLGMLRFGNHESPILLEALGDLLVAGYHLAGSAKQLAARAYLKASQHVDDDAAAQAYRDLAAQALEMQKIDGREATLEMIEAAFDAELAEGRAYFQRIERHEREWIEQGVDVDAKFHETFFTQGEPVQAGGLWPMHLAAPLAIGTAVAAAIFLVGLTLIRRWRQA